MSILRRVFQITNILQTSRVFFALACGALLLACLQCTKKETTAGLPRDVLGVSIGMNKEDVEKRLKEIAEFDREERRNQQVWRLKDNSHYSHLAVGYDKENKVRYASAIAANPTTKDLLRFTDIGDISQAKAEIVAPHYRYIWEVEPPEQPAYVVLIYGDNPDFLSFLSISQKVQAGEEKE